MKVAFHTLGCKVNQYESAAMAQMFAARGWEVVDEREFADVYVINTCTVTAIADKKSRQYIRRMKKINPDSVIAVTGCYAQISPDEVTAIKGVDIVTGTNEKSTLIDYIEDTIRHRVQTGTADRFESTDEAGTTAEADATDEAGAADRSETSGERGVFERVHPYEELGVFDEMGRVTSTDSRTRAYIKIQEGCNRFCSYCVIPYARGPVRSRALEDIVEEAKALIAAGYKELVLTGINTAQYDMEGRDLYAGHGSSSEEADHSSSAAGDGSEESFGVEKAIAAINALPGQFRIRLSSLEPAVVNAAYVKRLFQYEKLCRHLHMSAQSGSDKVLSAMNRPYDRNQYMEMVETLYQFDPCYGISTDIIVGFPGEKERDFEDSCRLVRACSFCKTHIFRYSKRPLTKAAEMKEQVSPQVKQKRSDQLQRVSSEAAKIFFERNIAAAEVGRRETVLFEEIVPADEDGAGIMKGDKLLTGYTGNYIRVYVPVRSAVSQGTGGDNSNGNSGDNANGKSGDNSNDNSGESLLGAFAKVRLEAVFQDGIAASVVK